MGFVNDSTVRKPKAPGAAPRPVGALGAEAEHATLTPIVKTKDGWDYGEPEVDARIQLCSFRSDLLDDKHSLFWSGMEVRVVAEDWPAYHDHEVVTALWPPSYLWYAHAPLRQYSADKTAVSAAVAAGTFHDLLFDAFQTDPGYWTARLDDPRRIHWENADSLGDGFLLGRNPNWSYRNKLTIDTNNETYKGPLWRFGICPDPTQVAAELFQSADCGNLLRETTEDVLFDHLFRAYRVRARVDSGDVLAPAKRFHDRSVEATEKRLPITRRGNEESESILHAAIWQCLAGRPNGSGQALHWAIRKTYTGLLEAFLKREKRTIEEDLDWANIGRSLLAKARKGIRPPKTKQLRLMLARISPELRRQIEALWKSSASS